MSNKGGGRQGVLGDIPKNTPKSTKKSKAQMHFANAALPPLPKIEYPKTSGCLSPVSRPLKPPEDLLPDYNPDNSFSQIERVTQHIGKIVTNYEEKLEDDSQKMRAEFDMQFASYSLQPTDIVKQSQKIVDELLSKNKELKETQNSLMDGISHWLKREEQTLQTATQPIDVPIIDEEVMQKMDSNAKNEVALKAVSIHSDIVSKSIMQIRRLEQKIVEQAQTIKDLKDENTKRVVSVQRRIDSKLDEATKRELEEAKKTIARLEAANKEQQNRIEQLIVDSIKITSSRSNTSAALAANYENSEKDVLIEQLQKQLSDLKEENNNIKTTIRLTQNEKEFLQSRITSLEEQIKTDRKKFDLQFRELINAKDDKSGKAGKDNASLKMIQTLRGEISDLQEKMNKQKQEDQQTLEMEIQRLRNEFEERELTFKQKMALKYANKNHRAEFEDFKNNEMQLRENMKKDHELEIEKLKADHQSEINSMMDEYAEKLEVLQGKLQEAEMANVDTDTAAKIEKITTDYEKRAIQLESDFNQRIQAQRQEFVRFKAKMDKDIEEKDQLIQQLSEQLKHSNSEADMHKLAREKTEAELSIYKQMEVDKAELIIPETNELPQVDIHGLAGEIRGRVESEFLKQRMAFESAMKNRIAQQKNELNEEFDKKMNEMKDEYEGKIYSLENDYKDQISQLEGIIDGMKQADQTNNLQAQTEELDARIKALELEKEQLIEQNKALSSAGIDDVTKAQLEQLLIESEEKQKEIDSLEKRLKDLKEKQRYVSTPDARRPMILSRKSLEHLYVDNSRDLIKRGLNSNLEICVSIPPAKKIDPSTLPPTLINQFCNTDPPMYHDAETITNNNHYQQLRICLDRSEGYVFVEVPEIEGRSEQSTARDGLPLTTRSSITTSTTSIETGVEPSQEQTEQQPQQNKPAVSKQRSNLVVVANDRRKQGLKISINEDKGTIIIEKPEIPSTKVSEQTEINTEASPGNHLPRKSSILALSQDGESLDIARQEEVEDNSSKIIKSTASKLSLNLKVNEMDEKPTIKTEQTPEKAPESALEAALQSSNRLTKMKISESSASVDITRNEPESKLKTSSSVDASVPPVLPKPERQAKTPELDGNKNIPFNSLLLRPLQSSVQEFDIERRPAPQVRKKMKLVYAVQVSVGATKEIEVDAEKVANEDGHFTKVFSNTYQHFNNYAVDPTRKTAVSCQVDIIETPKHKILKFIPPMEVFSLNMNIITPEEAPEVFPAVSHYNPPKTEVLSLVTAAGDVIEFPPRPMLAMSKDKEVIDVGHDMVIKEAAAIGKNLELVMSEIQNLHEEPDEEKKEQMMSKLGIQLDVEKDNLISQLKERVTELEQLHKQKVTLATMQTNDVEIEALKTPEEQERKPDTEERKADAEATSIASSSRKLEMSTTLSIAESEPEKKSQTLEINPVIEISRNEVIPTLSEGIQWTYDKNLKPLNLGMNQTESMFISAEAPKPNKRVVTLQRNPADEQALRKQAQEIDMLKKKIEELQNAKTPQQMSAVVSDINDTLQTVQEDGNNTDVIQLTGPNTKSKRSNLTTSSDVLLILNDAKMMSQDAFDAYEQSKTNSLEAAKNLNDTIEDFSNKIGPTGATPTEQVKLVKKVKDIAAGIGKTPEAPAKNDLANLYTKALDEINRQNDLINKLRREIVNLKQFSSASSAFVKVQQAEKELNALLENRSGENTLFNNYQDAATYIRSMTDQIKNDGSVASAGATPEVDQLKKLMNGGQPQWFTIKDLIGKIRDKMSKDIQKSLNEELIQDLTEKLDELTKANDELRKERIQMDRDRLVEREKSRIEYQKLADLYKNAQEYNKLLQKIQPKAQADNNASEQEKEITAQLQELQIKERQHLEELQRKIEQNSKLEQENLRLEGVIKQQEETFNKLFQQSADNQADKMMAGIRLEELIKEDEILRKKVLVLEGIRDDLNKQVADFTSKLGDSQEIINSLRAEIIKLQDQLVNQDVATQKKIIEEIKLEPKSEAARIVKLYQSKMDNMQQILENRGRELIKLGFRRAQDQKEILLMKAEINRLKRELKFQSMRYNTSKEDADFVRKSVATRDEVIREQKREIARLRSIIERFIAMKQIQALNSKEGESLINEIISSRGRIKYASIISKHRFERSHDKTTARFDTLLQRDMQRQMQVEQKRREFLERQEKQNMRILQDVALLARENELSLPETVVMQMMPKPKPSSKVSATQAKKEYIQISTKDIDAALKLDVPRPRPDLDERFQKEPSYADRLRAIGENQDKYPPEVIRSMLVAARHGKVVVPANTFNKDKVFPVITGKQLSTK